MSDLSWLGVILAALAAGLVTRLMWAEARSAPVRRPDGVTELRLGPRMKAAAIALSLAFLFFAWVGAFVAVGSVLSKLLIVIVLFGGVLALLLWAFNTRVTFDERTVTARRMAGDEQRINFDDIQDIRIAGASATLVLVGRHGERVHVPLQMPGITSLLKVLEAKVSDSVRGDVVERARRRIAG